MRSGIVLLAMLLLLRPTAASGQGGEAFTPTETIAPDIPAWSLAERESRLSRKDSAEPRVRSPRLTVRSC